MSGSKNYFCFLKTQKLSVQFHQKTLKDVFQFGRNLQLMNKINCQDIKRTNSMKNLDKNRVRTSQAKFRDKQIQSPFNVYNQSNRHAKKQSSHNQGNQEYFGRKPNRNDAKGFANQAEKQKIKLKTSSSEYQRLHDKLESIETRISEMKQNLQKKREEKEKRQKLKAKIDEQKRKTSISQEKPLSKKKNSCDNRKQTKLAKKNTEDTEERSLKSENQSLRNLITQQKSKTQSPNNHLKNLVTQVPPSNAHTFQNNPYSPRSNIYYVSQIVKAFRDEHSLAREHIKTSYQLLKAFQSVKLPSKEVINKKAVTLPRRRGYEDKKTIIFDLDETLIHCNQNLQMEHHVKLPIKFPTGDIIEAGINIRPGAQAILKNLNKNFQVIVFTASHPCYANVVIDYLDPTGELVHHRLFRENCYLMSNGPYIKDLRIIDRQPSKMVLVDNAAYSYVFQLDNGIPIIPYYNGEHDYQLKALQSYLQKLLFVDDVRPTNRCTFKLRSYAEHQNCEELVDNLYMR